MLPLLALLLSVALVLGGGWARADEKPTPAGFHSIFNGQDLTGWDGPPGAWRVEDGALTWESAPEKPLQEWTCLVWKGGEPENFALRLEC